MKKLYEKKPVLFAVLFIIVYCAVTIPIRGEFGDGSIQSLLGLSAVAAVIVSAVTFGIGHIVNLFAGMATVENIFMIVFAVAWGFIFTMVYYKSGNLLFCILVHAAVDVLSVFAAETSWGTWLYVGATVVIGAAYSVYLAKRVKPALP